MLPKRLITLSFFASIPGGEGNEALDFQTVVGSYNKSYSYASQLNNLIGWPSYPAPEAFIFAVGNGYSAFSRSNAFTVSLNGHATATQSLTPTGAPTIMGTICANNTSIAWGNVTVAGGVSTLAAGVGCSVIHMGVPNSGHTQITLNVMNHDGVTAHSFAAGGAAVVASVSYPPTGVLPTIIDVTPITGGTAATFDVYTYLIGAGGATPSDLAFQFHVVAN